MQTITAQDIEAEVSELEAAGHSAHDLAVMLATERAERYEAARRTHRNARLQFVVSMALLALVVVGAVVNFNRIQDLQQQVSDLTQTTQTAATATL